jgi:hypothetical protein
MTSSPATVVPDAEEDDPLDEEPDEPDELDDDPEAACPLEVAERVSAVTCAADDEREVL